MKILSTIFKISASDAGHANMRDLITVRCSTYNLKGITILDLPNVKSTTMEIRCIEIVELPDESRKIQTYTFKNSFKKH